MKLSGPNAVSSRLNLRRLFVLRNFLVACELGALAVNQAFALLPLPTIPLLMLVALQVLLNIWTCKRARSESSIGDPEFFAQLTADVFLLTGILYFTGGATNPFAWLYLIPLMVSATVLSARTTWLMAALTMVCYSLLMLYHRPLGDAHALHQDAGFTQHVIGMWVGFILSALLVAWFITGMAKNLRERDRALAQAREQALRDEQLVALGTLAAGAAHELGTPLATMAVLIGELDRDQPADKLHRKIEILREQIGRCKEALSVMSISAGEIRADSGGGVPVADFLERTLAQWRSQRVDGNIDTVIEDPGNGARILDERVVRQSLINLLNNAADASPEELTLRALWDEHTLDIDILDRGPGLHPDKAGNIGRHQDSDKEYGMGLGLLLSHATLRKFGGVVELSDRSGGGTRTYIRLPLLGEGPLS
jgi:two-component system sensor histidine kinase RegB